jgi:hypothetical protein
MGHRTISISVGGMQVLARLDDNETADKVWEALPISASASTWGDEIYFRTPISTGESPDSRAVQEVGAVAYWPSGQALCLFFGPTPASTGNEPRAISPVNPVGMIEDDPRVLRSIGQGAGILVERS